LRVYRKGSDRIIRKGKNLKRKKGKKGKSKMKKLIASKKVRAVAVNVKATKKGKAEKTEKNVLAVDGLKKETQKSFLAFGDKRKSDSLKGRASRTIAFLALIDKKGKGNYSVNQIGEKYYRSTTKAYLDNLSKERKMKISHIEGKVKGDYIGFTLA